MRSRRLARPRAGRNARSGQGRRSPVAAASSPNFPNLGGRGLPGLRAAAALTHPGFSSSRQCRDGEGHAAEAVAPEDVPDEADLLEGAPGLRGDAAVVAAAPAAVDGAAVAPAGGNEAPMRSTNADSRRPRPKSARAQGSRPRQAATPASDAPGATTWAAAKGRLPWRWRRRPGSRWDREWRRPRRRRSGACRHAGRWSAPAGEAPGRRRG